MQNLSPPSVLFRVKVKVHTNHLNWSIFKGSKFDTENLIIIHDILADNNNSIHNFLFSLTLLEMQKTQRNKQRQQQQHPKFC